TCRRRTSASPARRGGRAARRQRSPGARARGRSRPPRSASSAATAPRAARRTPTQALASAQGTAVSAAGRDGVDGAPAVPGRHAPVRAEPLAEQLQLFRLRELGYVVGERVALADAVVVHGPHVRA